ncbi:Transposase [Vibrio fluvialis PG41]|uniref:Transposase n=1 Tax=Vibrio fluvialis PG41 TaxID=1336752 RepID=S7I0K4_VIBFL|nr:RNA-guided endonuclease TnpB family protein [Vibrio fluvialis]EPP21579.1 Transposase [Vibrio fluvialis PG41]
MKIEKTYKFKLEPTSEQAEKLAQMAGCGRVVFNDSLEYVLNIIKKSVTITDKKVLYKHLNDLAFKDRKLLKKSFPNSAFLNKQLTSWKKLNHRLWLDNAFTDCLQQRQRDFVKALDEWSKGKRGFPVFRARKIAHHSTMRFPAPKKQISIQNKHIKLPNGLGLVRYRNSQPVIGELRNATVSLNAVGEWYISIMCLVEIELPTHVQGEMTGIDMGIAKNMTLSTDFCGNEGVFEGIHSFRAYQDKIAIEQRKLSRKVLGSENWKKQKLKVSKLHQRIANIRKDYQHKATSEISKNHAMVICEALKVANMSKSAKGDSENHGKNVAAKSGLNKSILDQGWHELRRQLEYKMRWKGGIYREVNPRNTSRECASCGHTEKENRKTQAEFICQSCGHSDNADKNAAKVILNRYLRELEQAA